MDPLPPKDHVWLLSECGANVPLGSELALDVKTDCRFGSHQAFVYRDGLYLRAEAVPVSEARQIEVVPAWRVTAQPINNLMGR